MSVLQSEVKDLYCCVQLRLRFRDRIYGGLPKHGDMLDYYTTAKHMSDAEKADFKKRVAAGELTDEEKAEIKETGWCQFEVDNQRRLCIWHGNIKALLREVFSTIGLTQKPWEKSSVKDKKDGYAGGRQTLQHAVHVDPLRPIFLKNGKSITKPDGYVDKVKHISDASGTRSALGRHDYIEQPELDIVIKWPKKSCFKIEDMRKAWALAQDDGLGACRSQGQGKFDVVVWDVLED